MLSGYSWLDCVLRILCVLGVCTALGSTSFTCVHLNLLC